MSKEALEAIKNAVLTDIENYIEEIQKEVSSLKRRYTKAGGRRLRRKLDALCKDKIEFKKKLIDFEKGS